MKRKTTLFAFALFFKSSSVGLNIRNVQKIIAIIAFMYSFSQANAQYTTIPDANFEAALVALGHDTTLDGQVLTSSIQTVTSLDVEDEGINDLTGIEDFTALVELYANENLFSTVDLSNNTALEILDLSNVPLIELDVSALTALRELTLVNNNLTNLNLKSNTNLTSIISTGNGIESYDLRNNALLEFLVISSSATKYINVQNGNNTNITFHAIYGNANLCVAVDDLAYSVANWGNAQSTDIYSDVFCRYTAIPDTNFEAALSSYDDNPNDGQVPTILIEEITSLSLNEKGITDPTGIEDFKALTSLSLRENNFASIDLSQNTLLETIDVQETTVLETVNLSGLTALQYLDINQTNLLSIDISDSSLLEFLNLAVTEISSLDVSNNTSLKYIYLNSTTYLSALDVSNCTNLIELTLNAANLESLDVRNGFNTNITRFDSRNNPNLSCILVDDAAYSTTNWTDKDTTTRFSHTYCRYTQIPDANFEAALSSYDDNPNDGQVPTVLIETITDLSIRNKNISDLSGIEDFTALEELDCSGNALTSADLSKNVNLIYLYIDDNQLTSLTLDAHPQLEELGCSSNQLTALDISGCTNLIVVEADNNASLATLDLSKNGTLEELVLSNCLFATIDLNANPQLTQLEMSENQLTSIDLSNNTQLQTVELIENQLNSIDVTGLSNLSSLILENNLLTTIDLSQNTNIRTLVLDKNQFTSLDLTSNTALVDVNITENASLSNITFGNSPNLRTLYLEQCALTSIDVSTFSSLRTLDISENELTALDVSSNTNMRTFSANDNQLTSLNVKNTNNSNFFSFDARNNPDLKCILVDDVTYSTNNWSNIDAGAAFNSVFCDNIAPVITLEGSSPITVELGSTYTDDGATALDDIDGDRTALIVVNNPVDTSVIGTYTVTYNVTDTTGNEATEATRIVNVVDTTAPVITLIGANPVTLEVGSGYTDEGATASDPINGDLTASIVVVNPVDTSVAGTYTITYNVTDTSGNTADEVTRTVNVIENCPIFDLPADNFNIQVYSETCEDKDNGVISIDATQASNYIATVNNESYAFSDTLVIPDLAPGTYPLCIAIDGYNNCEQCFEFVIEEAPVLAGKTTVDTHTEGNKVFVEVDSGTAPYTVMINDKAVGEYTTNSFYVAVDHGDVVEVLSSVACEGKLTTTISLFDGITAYPNPTRSDVTLQLPSYSNTIVSIAIYNTLGVLITSKQYSVVNGSVVLPMTELSAGVYFVSLSEDRSDMFRIIKK